MYLLDTFITLGDKLYDWLYPRYFFELYLKLILYNFRSEDNLETHIYMKL